MNRLLDGLDRFFDRLIDVLMLPIGCLRRDSADAPKPEDDPLDPPIFL
jgi:hypothetical protein